VSVRTDQLEARFAKRSRRIRPTSAASWAAGAIVLYLAISALAFWPVSPVSSTRLVGCACSDAAQEVWFLAWPAYALTHGTNPFFSGLLNYPGGVNLAVNTSMPLLGLIASPITLLAGPIAAFNLMLRLSFAASATSMFFVTRRFTTFWPASFLAGLLYGFSPYMVGQGFGHLFLTFVPLPPLIALLVHDICRYGGGRRLWRGIVLGLLAVAQFLISIEVLAATGICVAVVLVVTALVQPTAARQRVAAIASALGAALAVFIPLVAYPLWYFFDGPGHVVGPTHNVANLAVVKADLLSLVVPSLNERLGPARWIAIGTSFSGGDRPEIGSYLGVPFLILLAYLLWRFRRELLVRLGAGIGAVGLLFSLGSPLVVDRHDTGVPLPFGLLHHLPLLEGMVAARFSLFEQMGAAVVLGVGIDRWARGRATSAASSGGAEGAVAGRPRAWWRRAPLPAVLAVAVAVVALVPLLPRYPYVSSTARVPSYFRSAAVDAIPPGSVVLTYPYDIDPDNEGMLWQAVAGMRFAIFGGQAARPGPGGAVTSAVAPLKPGVVEQLFRAGMYGTGPGGAAAPDIDPVTSAAIRAFCRRYHVGTIVVQPIGKDPSLVIDDLARALGRAPVADQGALVWYRVAGDAR
jgi:hypothetical protein